MTVAVVGASMTQFGVREPRLRELLAAAGTRCLDDAGVEPRAVDHLYLSESGGAYESKGGLVNALKDDLGLGSAYATGIEQTSAAGGAGIAAAWRSVASGESDLSLLVGGEKMTHLSTPVTSDVVSAITHPVEYKHGVTIPSFAGLTARHYMERFGAPREALARVAVKNHRNGVDNPNAHFRSEITVETALDSPVVADPLRLYDFCPISDGSAALLFTTEERARDLTDDYALVAGVAGATGSQVVHERSDLTAMDAVSTAAERAYDSADFGPADLDVVELHDMFTILEFLQLEGIGVADRGTAWELAMDGVTARDGRLPVNTSGGLKSKGHPIGASGVAQAVELYEQLTDATGPRQVDADIGLACNVGGFGNAAVATILERR
ncbi:3-ketoacyl-CoA thiolase [Haloarcula mannanilytica]|uniref:3-ketoacyl-CoA thiolase n=1 Tax=Haloarcula mannanilytica TaxID=2509225 RepID=A0A4C2EM58_9EURY|nr:thiolase family protein [Haloarcula mannanilytica]GCF13309.1 3-ketoacyl-CoA thiolase [Haloarcula mannanilytica]